MCRPDRPKSRCVPVHIKWVGVFLSIPFEVALKGKGRPPFGGVPFFDTYQINEGFLRICKNTTKKRFHGPCGSFKALPINSFDALSTFLLGFQSGSCFWAFEMATMQLGWLNTACVMPSSGATMTLWRQLCGSKKRALGRCKIIQI